MIERLVITLRALADPAVTSAAVALDFDDAYLLIRQCQQLELTAAQRDLLDDVERLVANVNPEVAERDRLRSAANAALRALGYLEGPRAASDAR